LRDGSELAFMELVGRHHAAMVRLARSYVPTEALAEDVVQETWLAALRALPAFESRSSVRTWLYRILVNRARTIGVRERTHVPIPDPERVVASERFNSDGSWSCPPAPWVEEVEDRVRAEGMVKSIQVAMDDLPPAQREVLTLRDVDGLTAAEACEILDVGDGHQRVLLHRARTRLRNALEGEYGEVEP
jgi:RNA polymerase sigma-70 factor, ECF subfamily